MSTRQQTAHALAEAFLAGHLDPGEMVDRASLLLARPWRWLRPLALRVVTAYDAKPRPRTKALAKFIMSDRGFSRSLERHEVHVVRSLLYAPTMQPMASAETWRLPSICTIGELAEWLEITVSELA